jgi:hypothetical protein
LILFRNAVYAWLFVQTAMLIPTASYFWGRSAYILHPPNPGASLVEWALNLLSGAELAEYYPLFIAGQMASLAIGLTGRLPRVSAILVFWFTKNLNAHAWVILNGGHNLIEVMLLYIIIMGGGPGKHHPGCLVGRLDVTSKNFALLAAQLQIALVYCVSGTAKISGHLWQHGVALYYVLNTPEYSSSIAKRIASSDMLVTAGSYGTIVFMLSFPALVWFGKSRLVVLCVGVLLHLGIAFVMGLMDFGFAMIACYAVFIPERYAAHTLEFLWPCERISVSFSDRRLILISRLIDWRRLVTHYTPPGDEFSVNVIRGLGEEESLTGVRAVAEYASRIPLLLPVSIVCCLCSYVGISRSTGHGWRGGRLFS